MIYTTLEEAETYAKGHNIPRVLEMRCPKCKQTIYAATDDASHEHTSWFENLKANRNQRHVFCKRCGYGSMSSAESAFIFKTHEMGQEGK